MSSTAVAAPRSPWILGRVDDLVLFLATPVLILIAALGLRQVSDSRTIQYGIVAFGSLGHNLPGMMRAYGDRALFRRFRTRFLVAPVAFVGASVAFALTGSGGLVLIAYLWSIWHALMQVYGFLRIYDGRLGIQAPRIARLDFAMCLVWFGGAVVFSDARLFTIQSITTEFGVGPMSAATLHVVRQAAVAAIGVVSVAYTIGLLRDWRAGAPISGQKHLLYLTSIGFWWYAQVGIADVLLGLVLFEAFHDVQYLAIVWVFNRRRAQQPDAGAATRFLFGRSPALVLLYVGLCFAYGGLLPVAQNVETSAAAQLAIASAVQCSALLHYYYDGFLWKVRERSTQQALGIDGTGGRPDAVVTWHGIKWLALAAPAVALWFATCKPIGLAEAEALAASTPHAAEAHWRLGTARTEAGRPRDAVEALERALAITPGDALVETDLAVAKLAVGLELLRGKRAGEAEPWLAAAVARLPSLVERAVTAATEFHRQGHPDEAIVHLHAAAIMAPDMAAARLDLALLLRDAGRREEALQQARLGAALVPGDARAQALVRELEAKH